MTLSSLKKISFVGGGNMAFALIQGMIEAGVTASEIRVLEISSDARARYGALGVMATDSSAEALDSADVVVLAVKPQQLPDLLRSLAPQLGDALILSIAAGIRIRDLSRWLGGRGRIIRSMPNTPALVRAGVTGLYAPAEVNASDRATADTLLSAVGSVLWVSSERELDAVTALSGSGPAYVFHFLEGLYAAGEAMGLDADMTRILAMETLAGALKLASASPESPSTLRQRVTSPGGTTEAALKVLTEVHWMESLVKALRAAQARSASLSDEWQSR